MRKTRVIFVNLFFTRSQVVVRCSKNNFELAFKHCIIKDVYFAIIGKGSTNCCIQLFNSNFEGIGTGGISLKCNNLTAHFVSTSFFAIPVVLKTIYDQYKRFQATTVLIFNCTFDGRRKQMTAGLLHINPFASILNITVHSSTFSNHQLISSNVHDPTFFILDSSFIRPKAVFITLSNLLVENNNNKQPAIGLTLTKEILYQVQLLDSVFRNNSGALKIYLKYSDRRSPYFKAPITRLSNITFLQNFKLKLQDYGTINLFKGRFRLESCRFIDNTAGNNLYSALVVIADLVEVTFLNCYYENSQTDTKAITVYSNPSGRIFFEGNNTFNVIALKTEQAIFIHMPFDSDTVYNSGVFLKGYRSIGIFCPRGYDLNAESQCKVSSSTILCSYLYYSCRQCPPKTYSLNRGKLRNNTIEKVQCLKCPRGGQCENGQVTAKPDFWGYKDKGKVSFLACPPGYCCDKESCASYDGCHGNRSGILCGRCPEGMSESLFNTKCKANDECKSVFFWPGVSCFLLLYLLFFLYHEEITRFVRNGLSLKLPIVSKIMNNRNTQDSAEDLSCMNHRLNGHSKGSGFLKIIFYYYQIVHLFRNSVGAPREHQILGNLERRFFRAFNFIVINIPSFGCPFQNVRPVEKTLIVRSMGYCLLALVGFLYIFTKVFTDTAKKIIIRNNHRSQNTATRELFETSNPSESSSSRFSVRIASAFTYISLLMYSSSTQLCLSLLHCVRVGDKQVLFIDGNVKCYQTFQLFLVAYVVLSIFPFCLVPVLGSYLLKLHRISVSQYCIACIFPLPFCCYWTYLLLKDSPLPYNTVEQDCDVTTQQSSTEGISSRTAILKILLGPFRRHEAVFRFPSSFLPWEGLLIFRRLVLIVVLTFIYDNRLKMFIALVICVIILISHMYVKPFTSSADNFMETLSLGTLIVVCGLTFIKAFYQGEDFSSSNSSSALLNSFEMVEEILIIVPLGIAFFIFSLSLSIKLMFGLQQCFRVCLQRLGRFCRK